MKQRYVNSNRYCVKFNSEGPATYQTRATKSFTNQSFTIRQGQSPLKVTGEPKVVMDPGISSEYI